MHVVSFRGPVAVATVPSSSSSEAHRQVRRRYLEQELLEVSAVGIPANPNALSLAYKSGAVQKTDLQETIALLQKTIAPNPAINPSTLSLLRQLHSIIKA
jgi:hypothetical protein